MTANDISVESRQECFALANAVLLLYVRSIEMRRLSVAEHLLQALKELAECEPRCKVLLDEAYIRIASLPRPSS